MSQFRAFIEDDRGSTVLEYALIAGIVSVGIIASLHSFDAAFDKLAQRISDAMTNL